MEKTLLELKEMNIMEEEETRSSVEQQVLEDPHPLGDLIRVRGRGRTRRDYYEAFSFDGRLFSLEDPVLLAPVEPNQKPGIGIIKDIAETPDGKVIVTGQMFYRPEDAQKRNCGYWESRFKRELFYSFRMKKFPAECVMHKCVVHFIPDNKQLPHWKEHPGFIVQKIYDTKQKRLYNIADDDYAKRRRKEIDLLVQNTVSRLRDLPDIEPKDDVSDEENHNSQHMP